MPKGSSYYHVTLTEREGGAHNVIIGPVKTRDVPTLMARGLTFIRANYQTVESMIFCKKCGTSKPLSRPELPIRPRVRS